MSSVCLDFIENLLLSLVAGDVSVPGIAFPKVHVTIARSILDRCDRRATRVKGPCLYENVCAKIAQ